MADTLQTINYVTAIVVFFGGGFLGLRYFFKGRVQDDTEKFTSLMQSIQQRDIEIGDMKRRLDKLESENVQLHTDNAKLISDAAVLANTVNGKEYLLAIMESIKDFQKWAKQASEQHTIIMQGNADIKALLELNRRNVDRNDRKPSK